MWKNIIKTEPKRRMNERRKPQTIESGGERPTSEQSDWQQRYSNKEESLEENDKLNEADLAEMTRHDLLEVATEWIETLDEKELMKLLIHSLGKIDINYISYDDKNRKDES